jgi:hypothetical protein
MLDRMDNDQYVQNRNMPNLLLKLELNGKREVRIERATRIKIDGRGSLLVYSSAAASPRRVCLEDLKAFSIQPFNAFSAMPVLQHVM